MSKRNFRYPIKSGSISREHVAIFEKNKESIFSSIQKHLLPEHQETLNADVLADEIMWVFELTLAVKDWNCGPDKKDDIWKTLLPQLKALQYNLHQIEDSDLHWFYERTVRKNCSETSVIGKGA